jgi:ribosomal protein S18 acetylase RimI-like enzyme
MDILIRRADVTNASLLARLGAQTFHDAFATFNSAEDMETYMQSSFTEDKLKAEIQTDGAEFYIAHMGDEPLGFAKTGQQAPPDEIAAFKCRELERIYVLKEHQSLKVGEKLLTFCIEKAKAEKYEVMWLGVWEHNPRAVAFYQRFGFERFGEHDFQLGSDTQTDWLMMLNLR